MLPIPIIPGIYPDIPEKEYRKAQGVSQTSLKEMRYSFAHYAEALTNPARPTAPMIKGRIAHSLLLTPDAPKDWVVKPKDHDGRTKEGRAWLKANQGKTSIEFEEWGDIVNAVAAAKAHPFISMALDGAQLELSIWSNYYADEGRVIRKGRLDIVPPGPAIGDAKFVQDATEEAFSKMVADFKYYVQAAYYIDLYNENLPPGEEEKTKFAFFAIELFSPYAIRVYNLNPDDISRGRREYKRYLEILAGCWHRDVDTPYHAGSAYSLQIKDLSLPQYTRKRIDETFL